ncbi:hypothetical protein ASPZODRAFT_167574 [Penicilliopsis zonata CBS 506.65]|uniref:T6SS Phospholipase effector Tle1-like catalytic domain-containing protein n=1 Tax=Penicilliopsis zonata CBS 506.65 TaxID=1073090 RepID=A0A1L9SF65_9EURO|nr:hypothetical protein ASPZODRAFT_167574 [Penicilliopsis zonata CBS 506.65]OJJ45860.1 hypothetical protein ASPZODRAFT_167574 [Penicilliopsis zonata CBS 506.65]
MLPTKPNTVPNKRLIVCCDGTWQDSTADARQPPSNVTRLTRALSRNATITVDGEKIVIPQITYYQKGVGTGLGDRFWGGAAGLGLSANVRSGYGFVADNYNPGDKIYFFGFSRGAYTARAIAGLVLELGLLTPRGMDNFSIVYDDFYNHKIDTYTAEKRAALGFRPPLPKYTVEIIGVWDTVGFHESWLGKGMGEKLEYRTTQLSPDVRYAFHALALDEDRSAYSPVLWTVPCSHPCEHGKSQEVQQVWFSGVHTDVGGGAVDARLSNIALAWMIAQCSKDDQLAFDESYLLDNPPKIQEEALIPWATSRGRDAAPFNLITFLTGLLLGKSPRTPMEYHSKHPGGPHTTNETLHESIRDRRCEVLKKMAQKDAAAAASLKKSLWPCKPLKKRKDEHTWLLTGEKEIAITPASNLETYLKGRIRTVHVNQTD